MLGKHYANGNTNGILQENRSATMRYETQKQREKSRRIAGQ